MTTTEEIAEVPKERGKHNGKRKAGVSAAAALSAGVTTQRTLHRSAWEIHAQQTIDELRSAIDIGQDEEITKRKVNDLLDVAERYLEDGVRRPRRLGRWVRGTNVEGTWTYIHAARACYVHSAPGYAVAAMVPAIAAAVRAYLPKDHEAAVELADWRKQHDISKGDAVPIEKGDRALLANVLSSAYAANAESYVRLRRFRNILLAWAAFMFAIVLVMAVTSTWKPSMLSMCFDTDPDEPGLLACPTRWGAATGGDVTLVASLGVAGAAIVSTRSVTQSTRASTVAYSLRVARALLKLAMGGLTAIIGILAWKAEVMPALGAVDGRGAILFYAVVFGGAQQLVTRLVDQQAERALASASSDADHISSGPPAGTT